jgi:hypothetical protein
LPDFDTIDVEIGNSRFRLALGHMCALIMQVLGVE